MAIRDPEPPAVWPEGTDPHPGSPLLAGERRAWLLGYAAGLTRAIEIQQAEERQKEPR